MKIAQEPYFDDTELSNGYFAWLSHFIGKDEDEDNNYSSLLAVLSGIEFYDVIPNDVNRMKYGKLLRSEYLKSIGRDKSEDEDWINLKPVSVLEVLIGLAEKMNFFVGTEVCDDAAAWVPFFFELLNNLCLSEFTNKKIAEDSESRVSEIKAIVQRWLDRDYDQDGNGGVFPLKYTFGKDQRFIELWYQMHAYINENYLGMKPADE